ncbi:IS66 family insertion sequence element accessory protein TnpB [Endozoicomonas sp. 4G]|uniref:IS66 family insertion sequence element accessory protein TnpB n=1 Tax=Endozoicomonas sp. 4G TaxID=2872754 RepID=UPI0020791CD6|nr:IS66 family insertion sequence element accessory protein TnpB [Endozoicomonas sp. 4G]
MFYPESQVRVWLYNRSTDMRKSYDGLSALVRNKLEEDPLSGQLFVFINRKQTQCKVLYFDRSGYCIWSKRLEQGQFHAHAGESHKKRLEWTDLKLILEGIDTRSVQQYKRYKHQQSGYTTEA